AGGVGRGRGGGGGGEGGGGGGERAGVGGELGEVRGACGVVGEGGVGVDGDDDPGHGKHRGGSNRDPIQTAERVADEDAGRDHDHRQRGRHHADGLSRDDVRRVARD